MKLRERDRERQSGRVLPRESKHSPIIISLEVMTPVMTLCRTLLSLTKVMRASANLEKQEISAGVQRWKTGKDLLREEQREKH